MDTLISYCYEEDVPAGDGHWKNEGSYYNEQMKYTGNMIVNTRFDSTVCEGGKLTSYTEIMEHVRVELGHDNFTIIAVSYLG